MVELAGLKDVPTWFVVLPDCASAAPAAAAVRGLATQEIDHPSRRPWLVGCWPDGAAAVGAAGRVKIAVIGQHAVSAGKLTAAAAQAEAVADLDGLAGSLVGSVHIVASVDGQLRVQGSVAGLRRVFHAQVAGVTLAADRADVLAGLLRAGVDEQRLAMCLLDVSVLYPLAGQPVWRGVQLLASDHYLALDRDGRPCAVRWWTPPEPVLSLCEGVRGLREALLAAVEVRGRGRDLVSCDLGGLDSTSVCSVAVHCGRKVVAYTADGRDPVSEDVAWARRTVAELGGRVEHQIIAGDQRPFVYEDLRGADDRFDEPCPAVVDRAAFLVIPRLAVARGSRLHLTGFGGDELLGGSPAHLHTMVRTNPRIALRNLRGFATQRKWPYRTALRQLMDRRSYRAWLSRVADHLTAPSPAMEAPSLDWGTPPRLPPWATPETVETVRAQIRAAARTVEPRDSRRGRHLELEGTLAVSRMVRQLEQMAARVGLALASPYYDDRVIKAVLAVRPQEKVTPWRYKPLIVEAMRGIVPEASLTRRTKDEGSHEVEVGLREKRGELLALCEDSRLARLGLIDVDAFREVCSRPLPPSLQFDALYQTVACEVWLRTLDKATVAG